MTEKIIRITECSQCPYAFKFDRKTPLECDKKERAIPDIYSIPSWCPLEDAPPKEQNHDLP